MADYVIVEPQVEILTPCPIDGMGILKQLEKYGRTCYKSEDKITEDSALQFVKNIIARGHESVLEHVSITARVVCDRGVTHEIVRHRIAAYSQESTRYCDYNDQPMQFIDIEPHMVGDKVEEALAIWDEHMCRCAEAYRALRAAGQPPQIARSVLPNSLKTEIIMTYNVRQWRHFFRLRTSPKAHPQMQEIAKVLLQNMAVSIPVVFADVYEVVKKRKPRSD